MDQLVISDVNLHESSSMTSVKEMDSYNPSSAAIKLPTEEGIYQVGESAKVGNSRTWKYLTKIILYVLRDLEVGTQ